MMDCFRWKVDPGLRPGLAAHYWFDWLASLGWTTHLAATRLTRHFNILFYLESATAYRHALQASPPEAEPIVWEGDTCLGAPEGGILGYDTKHSLAPRPKTEFAMLLFFFTRYQLAVLLQHRSQEPLALLLLVWQWRADGTFLRQEPDISAHSCPFSSIYIHTYYHARADIAARVL